MNDVFHGILSPRAEAPVQNSRFLDRLFLRRGIIKRIPNEDVPPDDKKHSTKSIAALSASQAVGSSRGKGFRLSRPKVGCEKSASHNPVPCRLDMGIFATRAATRPRQFLAVGKKVTATDTPGRNNDASLAMGSD
jgi:hypothetical protein